MALLGRASPKRLETATRRDLAKARAAFERVAYAWSEVDGVVTEEMDGLIATIDTIAGRDGPLEEAVAQLNEPWVAE